MKKNLDDRLIDFLWKRTVYMGTFVFSIILTAMFTTWFCLVVSENSADLYQAENRELKFDLDSCNVANTCYQPPPKTVIKRDYSKSRNKTRTTYSDGSESYQDGAM